jgi:hypothetical protein
LLDGSCLGLQFYPDMVKNGSQLLRINVDNVKGGLSIDKVQHRINESFVSICPYQLSKLVCHQSAEMMLASLATNGNLPITPPCELNISW